MDCAAFEQLRIRQAEGRIGHVEARRVVLVEAVGRWRRGRGRGDERGGGGRGGGGGAVTVRVAAGLHQRELCRDGTAHLLPQRRHSAECSRVGHHAVGQPLNDTGVRLGRGQRAGGHRQDVDAQLLGGGGGRAEAGGEQGLHRASGGRGGYGDDGGKAHGGCSGGGGVCGADGGGGGGDGDADGDERRVDLGRGRDASLHGCGVRVVAHAATGRHREHDAAVQDLALGGRWRRGVVQQRNACR